MPLLADTLLWTVAITTTSSLIGRFNHSTQWKINEFIVVTAAVDVQSPVHTS